VIDRFADSAVLCRSGVAVSATVSVGWPNWATPAAMWQPCSAWPTARFTAKTLSRNRLEPALVALVQPAMAVA
jgi:hypothetical protein